MFYLYRRSRVLTCVFLPSVEEVEDPPDVSHRTAAHMESLTMQKLKDEYIKKHPEVWKTTTTEPGAQKPKLNDWPQPGDIEEDEDSFENV